MFLQYPIQKLKCVSRLVHLVQRVNQHIFIDLRFKQICQNRGTFLALTACLKPARR